MCIRDRYENLSQAWVLLGNLEEAEICLKKYLENNQSSFSAWKALGDILVDQGKEEESEKAYKNAISTDPKYIKLQEAMGLIQKGNLGEAEKIYREILAEDPENVDAIRLLALLASRAGSNDHAIRMLESCVKIAPDYALAWENLAKLYRQKDDQESLIKASKCFSKATELRPDWAEGWAGLGTMQTRSSQHDDGIESYQKSLSLKENQPRVHLSLGHVYKTTGSQDKSIGAYKDAIKFDEKFGEAYWSLANLKTYRFDEKELNDMELQIDNQDIPEREKIHFLFSGLSSNGIQRIVALVSSLICFSVISVPSQPHRTKPPSLITVLNSSYVSTVKVFFCLNSSACLNKFC